LVLVVERSAAAIVHWSNWRRWHQVWARYHQYRARAEKEPEQQSSQGLHKEVEQDVDAIEVVWSRLVALLPDDKRVGHPLVHERRVILEAIVHVMRTNCGWQHLPAHYPPWKTVHWQYMKWRKSGIWDTIWAGFAYLGSSS
jgi:hypothetical protein